MTFWVALLPSGIPGVSGGRGGAGVVAISQDSFPFIGQVLAQELGHAFGRPHTADCGEGSWVDACYPSVLGLPTASIGEFGFDVQAGITHHPATSHDFMSYCPEQWVSAYTWARLIEAIPAVLAGRAAPIHTCS